MDVSKGYVQLPKTGEQIRITENVVEGEKILGEAVEELKGISDKVMHCSFDILSSSNQDAAHRLASLHPSIKAKIL